VALDNGGV